MPSWTLGLSRADLDTPALCLDLLTFDANLHRLAEIARRGGKAWRPHAKGHKSAAVAWRQRDAGAIGVTCAKVSEADVFAFAGIRDILIANVIAGEKKAERLAALCHDADPIICVDDPVQIEQIAAACRRHGVTCRVLVDIDLGMQRTGVQPGEAALALAQAVSGMPGLKLAGVMGYEGHLLQVADKVSKTTQIRTAHTTLGECRDLFLKAGLCCDIVSAGGSGSVAIAAESPELTEVQAGGAVFGDPFYTQNCHTDLFHPALTIWTTIVSRPAVDRAVLDAGKKTVNPDLAMPRVKDWPDARVTRMSAEHTVLELGPESRDLKIGDRIQLIVGYHDLTNVLHDEFLVFRDDRLEAVWPITGRGRLQ